MKCSRISCTSSLAITELEEKRGAERKCATNHRAAAMVNPSEPERANQLHTLTA